MCGVREDCPTIVSVHAHVELAATNGDKQTDGKIRTGIPTRRGWDPGHPGEVENS